MALNKWKLPALKNQIEIQTQKAMKRIFTIIAIVAASVMVGSNTANAQIRGEMGAGLNFEIATGEDYTNYGLGVKYQWTFLDNMRLEPSFTYFFKKDNISSWDLTANLHYMFDLSPMMNIYPILGMGMTGLDRDYEPLGLNNENDTKFAFNFGGGMEFMFTPSLGMEIEYKYRIVDSWNRSHFTFGAVYKF